MRLRKLLPHISAAFLALALLSPFAARAAAPDFKTALDETVHNLAGFIQIDTGRIGGIGPAKEIADYFAYR